MNGADTLCAMNGVIHEYEAGLLNQSLDMCSSEAFYASQLEYEFYDCISKMHRRQVVLA